jgi:hypothetical protein
MAEKRGTYRLLVGKSEGGRRLRKSRRRWMDNIKIDHVEIGWCGLDWVGLAQDKYRWRGLVNAVMNLQVS